MKKIYFYATPMGKMGIAEADGAITDLYFSDGSLPEGAVVQETELLKKAAAQLNEYFDGQRKGFELPLAAQGTAFQQAVWQALQSIPYGETRSYKEIAEQIGRPKACRAVGMANNRNPIAIIVPCHRVIGANGQLVGYAGGLSIKEYLLQLERVQEIRTECICCS